MIKLLLPGNDAWLSIRLADSFWSRLRGLLGTASLDERTGLLLCSCNSVHMVGMRYPIDIIYLDSNQRIIKIVENLQPWWGCSICLRAASTLEIAAAGAKKYQLQVGQVLQFG